MEDVLDVYKRPYDANRPVICMDETSKQLIKEVRRPIPAKPGMPERYDCEYERGGTCNIFMFGEPLAGWRNADVTDRRTAQNWAHQIKHLLDVSYPSVEKVILVMDNLNTHSGASLYKAFPPEEAKRLLDRLEIHYTPKHGSWLNMTEIELQVLSRQCLNRRLPDKDTVIAEVAAWQSHRNNRESIIDWQFTTESARIKLKRLYPSIID